jgi:hypothetical protein
MSYGPDAGRWRIKNPEELNEWAFQAHIPEATGVAVLEFFRDRVRLDPDFGEFIDENTRGELVPGTDVEAIWTFDPSQRYFEVVTPRATRT